MPSTRAIGMLRRYVVLALLLVSVILIGGSGAAASTPPSPSWNGDFSTGDWSQYDDCRSNHVNGIFPGYYAIDTLSGHQGSHPCGRSLAPLLSDVAPPAGFAYTGKFTVGPSATTGQAGQRTLDTLWPDNTASQGKSRAYQGASAWYRDEEYFPQGFTPIANSNWNWTFEIHNWPNKGGTPDVACGLDTATSTGMSPYTDGVGHGTRLSCRVVGGASPANPIDSYSSSSWFRNPDVRYAYPVGVASVQLRRWYDLVLHVKWSWQQDARNGCTDPSSRTGCFEWWVDGTKVAAWSGPTLLYYQDNNSNVSGATPGPGQGYLQTGYYRSMTGTTTVSVYHAATMIGPTAASIGELM